MGQRLVLSIERIIELFKKLNSGITENLHQ